MIEVLALGVALGAAQTSPPSTPSATPTVVVRGHRTAAPDGKVKVDTSVEIDNEDISEQYGPIWPSKAFDLGVSGRVVLACKITANGFARSCDIASEAPLNMGFGEAALQLQPSLRVKPPTDVDASGSVVMNIGVNFDAPQDAFVTGAGAQGMPKVGATFTTGGRISPLTGRPMIMQSVTMMEHPIWSSAPSFSDMRNVYPARATRSEGFVVLRCNVERSGSLWGCDISKEQPLKAGFDRAALALAPLFRVAPEVMAKAPDRRALQVVVPIRFAPSELDAEPKVESPAWISGFDPEIAPKVFPPEAVARGLTTGHGVARCMVGEDGVLTGCSPEKADPDGAGFSEAAVVLASTMKMNLWSVDAGPVRGGVIRVPIRLNLAPPQ